MTDRPAGYYWVWSPTSKPNWTISEWTPPHGNWPGYWDLITDYAWTDKDLHPDQIIGPQIIPPPEPTT